MVNMGSVLPAETRRQAYEEDSRWPAKAISRVLATVFASVAAILLAYAVSETNENFFNTQGNGDWTDGLALAPVLLSLLYNPLTLIFHFILRKGRHFHPAWHVAGDLIIWTFLVPVIVLTVAGGLYWEWAPAIVAENGRVDCGFAFNQWSRECLPIAYTIGRVQIAAIVFLFLLFVLHFTLFVYACLETRKWRKAAKIEGFEKKGFELQYSKDVEQQSFS